MIEWRKHFIEDCNRWWRMWSSWLAVLWGMIVTAIWNEPTVLQELANAMPDSVRGKLSPLVFALVAGLPIFVRLLKQNIPPKGGPNG